MSTADRYGRVCQALAREPRRWLVTGAAGFIGSALTERLLELGQSVIGLDNFMTGRRSNVEDVMARVGRRAERFQLIVGDIRNRECCALACRGVDVVLHQAALGSVQRSIEDPLTTHQCNVDGFVNVVLAARDAGVRRIVYASSSAVYGDRTDLPHVEPHRGEPLSPYALSKRVNELYAAVFARNYGLELCGLRYFNVFGRRQDPGGAYAAVIPRWMEQLIRGERCTIFGDPGSTRDYCSVSGVVQANLLAATAVKVDPGAAYNVGSGEGTRLGALYEAIRSAVAPHRPDVADLAPVLGEARPGDVAHSRAHIGAISAALGYEPCAPWSADLAGVAQWYARRQRPS
ncbi:MAG: NAD-dependent epimerase/dehydratase family protein [Deltaproteobacteria bacterium]|jgi:UDP-N-acetylglucosamine 4-epimerase|nr:NAD-dependent epimerase/dehydratase family protein [Deltaproteobacteria bacterium]MBW2536468.1 NAD-dependent epimerase/dehydratase family protein [Deltaproteobacteria bacterium]